jgi:PAS domain S-box-containing protein
MAEEPLLERWERLAGIAECATDGIIVVDEGQRILLFNGAAAGMFDCSEQDAIGSHLERFVPPRLRAEHAAGFERVRGTEPRPRTLGRLPTLWGLRTNGEEFPCEASIAQHETRHRREFTIIIRDISERKKAEDALVRRVEFDTFFSELSSRFIGLPDEKVDANMALGLASVGEFLQMDRVALLELSRDRAEMTRVYSWSRSEEPASPPVLTKRMQPWWLEQVLRGDVSLTSHLDDLPEAASAEKEYLRRMGVASAASIPLRVGGEIAGAISFITRHRHVSWTVELVNHLKAISDILWNALKRHQAMQALLAAQSLVRESEERFRLIASTAPVIIWMSDVDKQSTYINESWMRLTGQSREAALGNGWADGIHPEDRERSCATYANAFDRREPFQMEYRLRRHDGEYRWIFAQGVPRVSADGSFVGYIGSAIDVTDRKRAEDALSTVSQRLLHAQEQERARLARELHDDINQRLALLVLSLKEVTLRVELSAPELSAEIGKAIDAAVTLTSDVQGLSHRLHSSKLQFLGLESAARDVCRELSERWSVAIHFESKDVDVLPEDVCVVLYRVLQEALNNAIKHSGSKDIRVLLQRSADEITLTVEDTGVGFEPTKALTGRGLGLISMKERLKLIHGEVTIKSHSPGGTTITASVPLVPRERFANAI